MSYKLMGGDLRAPVGQKVEVTAMMTKDAGQAKTASEKTKMGGTLDVKSIKMLASTCW